MSGIRITWPPDRAVHRHWQWRSVWRSASGYLREESSGITLRTARWSHARLESLLHTDDKVACEVVVSLSPKVRCHSESPGRTVLT